MDLAELHRVSSYVIAAVVFVLAIASSTHAVLYKRDSRAALLWVGFIWLVPVAGALLYFIFGYRKGKRRGNVNVEEEK